MNFRTGRICGAGRDYSQQVHRVTTIRVEIRCTRDVLRNGKRIRVVRKVV